MEWIEALRGTVVGPDGDLAVRQTYDFSGVCPRLQVDRNGNISVAGGVRRVAEGEPPVGKKAEDDAKPAKP